MTPEEFVNAVWARLDPRNLTAEDVAFFRERLPEFFELNWTVQDTARYVMWMEPFDMTTPEEIALAEMEKISNKYRKVER